MSGGVRSGLIFGAVALLVAVGFSFVPLIGAFCCGPLGAVIAGGIAGYLGLRWSDIGAGIGTGVLAGGIAGVGGLLGSVIFYIVAISMLQSTPEFNATLEQAMRQQPEVNLTPEDMRTMVGGIVLLAGFCTGLITLLFSLGAGAFGAWLELRQRTPSGPPPIVPVG